MADRPTALAGASAAGPGELPCFVAQRHAAGRNLRFLLINPKTGHRGRIVTLDAETDEEVPRRDLVKGYEFEKRRCVLLDDDDFARSKVESSSMVTVEKFVARETIDPVHFDNSYCVVPDGEAGVDVYIVLHESIGETGQAALKRGLNQDKGQQHTPPRAGRRHAAEACDRAQACLIPTKCLALRLRSHRHGRPCCPRRPRLCRTHATTTWIAQPSPALTVQVALLALARLISINARVRRNPHSPGSWPRPARTWTRMRSFSCGTRPGVAT